MVLSGQGIVGNWYKGVLIGGAADGGLLREENSDRVYWELRVLILFVNDVIFGNSILLEFSDYSPSRMCEDV